MYARILRGASRYAARRRAFGSRSASRARGRCGNLAVGGAAPASSPRVATKWRRSGTSPRTSSAMRRQSSASPVEKVTTTASGSLPSSRKIQRLRRCFTARPEYQSTAQAASGVNAATTMTGVQRWVDDAAEERRDHHLDRAVGRHQRGDAERARAPPKVSSGSVYTC